MKKSDLEKVKEVTEAIVNTQDHGTDCGCTICLADNKTIAENPSIVNAVANAFKQKR